MNDMFVDEESTPEQTTNDKIEDDLRIIYHRVDLPSMGKLGYPDYVEYRDILVRDEKILSTTTNKDFRKTLNDILKSLLKDKSFYEKMSSSDRDFLLLWVWANNYSTIKKFEVTCPYCVNKDTISIDLTEVTINNLSDDYIDSFKMNISNGEEITLRLITVGDEDKAENFVKNNPSYELTSVLFAMATDFSTRLPLKEKLKYIDDNLTGKDMSMIRAYHNYFNYGIDDNVKHTCTSCSEVTNHKIPFSEEFFMPTIQDDFEKLLQFNKVSEGESS